MSGPEFFQTVMGQRFYGSTAPRIAEALENLVKVTERANDLKERELKMREERKAEIDEMFDEEDRINKGEFGVCRSCGSPLTSDGFCTDPECPYITAPQQGLYVVGEFDIDGIFRGYIGPIDLQTCYNFIPKDSETGCSIYAVQGKDHKEIAYWNYQAERWVRK